MPTQPDKSTGRSRTVGPSKAEQRKNDLRRVYEMSKPLEPLFEEFHDPEWRERFKEWEAKVRALVQKSGGRWTPYDQWTDKNQGLRRFRAVCRDQRQNFETMVREEKSLEGIWDETHRAARRRKASPSSSDTSSSDFRADSSESEAAPTPAKHNPERKSLVVVLKNPIRRASSTTPRDASSHFSDQLLKPGSASRPITPPNHSESYLSPRPLSGHSFSSYSGHHPSPYQHSPPFSPFQPGSPLFTPLELRSPSPDSAPPILYEEGDQSPPRMMDTDEFEALLLKTPHLDSCQAPKQLHALAKAHRRLTGRAAERYGTTSEAFHEGTSFR
ncbi:hypothetical protein JCM11641_001092 [Rhodosporidiobolus odoratus]